MGRRCFFSVISCGDNADDVQIFCRGFCFVKTSGFGATKFIEKSKKVVKTKDNFKYLLLGVNIKFILLDK